VEGVTGPDPAADGARRAEQLLAMLTAGEQAAADTLLGDLDRRDLVFTGAGLTAIARGEGRRLPPAQRAQASARQVRLATLRDANRYDADGMRAGLQRAAEEVLRLRSLTAAADRPAG
jgi:hypothetical protein